MGARLLRSWLLRPSVRRGEIEARLSAVEDLHRSQMRRDRVRILLKDVSDLERLTARINMGTATPRDLVALRRSLNQVPSIRRALSDAEASLRARSGSRLSDWAQLSGPELELLLELLGVARQVDGRSTRSGVTGDGRWRVTLAPPDGGPVKRSFWIERSVQAVKISIVSHGFVNGSHYRIPIVGMHHLQKALVIQFVCRCLLA